MTFFSLAVFVRKRRKGEELIPYMAKKAPQLKVLKRTAKRPTVLLALGWYAAAIHRGIARYARQAGWILDIRMLRSGHLPVGWEGEGIICNLHIDSAVDEFVEETRVPVVNIGNLQHARIPNISSDNAAVGRMAAEYYLQRGFKHFAFYSRSGSLGEKARGEAFQTRIREAGWKTHRLDWVTFSRPLSAQERDAGLISWLTRQIAALPKPVAIFSEYDDFAVEVINACQSSHLPVPEQVAVLGVGDDPLRCEFAPVALSSIDDDEELIGYEAAALLGRMINKEKGVKSTTLVPPRAVTTRLSTDILAVEHPLVASALRTIWDHYTEAIGAKQIAATVPMSYRRLHDAFIQHVGHSISDEITRKRLEHAQKLLEETDKKTLEVAWLSGFTDHDRMGKVFKRVLGVTPASYRKRFKASAKA